MRLLAILFSVSAGVMSRGAQLVADGGSTARLDLRQPETALGLRLSPCSAAIAPS